MLAKLKRKKEPITPNMLRSLVASMSPKPLLAKLQLVVSALIAYAAFLLFEEMAKLNVVTWCLSETVCLFILHPA